MKPHNFSKRFACPNYYFLGPFSTDFSRFFVIAVVRNGALPLPFLPVRINPPLPKMAADSRQQVSTIFNTLHSVFPLITSMII